MEKNVNVDLCGIRNLLGSLEQHGFSKAELQRIMTRIAVQTGADIIFTGK